MICFNYTYYTMAHKCNVRLLLAIPALYYTHITLVSHDKYARLKVILEEKFPIQLLFAWFPKWESFAEKWLAFSWTVHLHLLTASFKTSVFFYLFIITLLELYQLKGCQVSMTNRHIAQSSPASECRSLLAVNCSVQWDSCLLWQWFWGLFAGCFLAYLTC